MIQVPTVPVEAAAQDPRRLFIFSQTKVGKTEAAVQLPDSILIDLEDGSEFVTATKVNLKKTLEEHNLKNPTQSMTLLQGLEAVAKDIKAKNAEKGTFVFKYGIIDTATALEDLANEYACHLYKATEIGKNWKGSDITTLPKGAGYNWLRIAFEKLYSIFDGLFGECLILLGHTKNSSITKEGKELSARDINLTGKLKHIVSANVDAIGYMYRDKETSQNILSFKTSEQDLATGARPKHLRGQEIIISEMVDGTLETYWNRVFTKLQ